MTGDTPDCASGDNERLRVVRSGDRRRATLMSSRAATGGARPSCHPEQERAEGECSRGSRARRMALVTRGQVAPAHSLRIAQIADEMTSDTTGCASGDTARARLTCWRQRARQTVPLATINLPD